MCGWQFFQNRCYLIDCLWKSTSKPQNLVNNACQSLVYNHWGVAYASKCHKNMYFHIQLDTKICGCQSPRPPYFMPVSHIILPNNFFLSKNVWGIKVSITTQNFRSPTLFSTEISNFMLKLGFLICNSYDYFYIMQWPPIIPNDPPISHNER